MTVNLDTVSKEKRNSGVTPLIYGKPHTSTPGLAPQILYLSSYPATVTGRSQNSDVESHEALRSIVLNALNT